MYSSDYGRTGDPRLDMHYSNQGDSFQLPEEVRRFLLDMYSAMQQNDVLLLRRLYEERLPLLNQEYFEEQPWPEADDIAPYLGDNSTTPIFLVLYKEIYYRHLYALPAPHLEPLHRFESYFNYCSLFNMILSTDQPLQLELPDQWLWNIVDEFIYQFQTFTQYRSRLSKRSAEELELLRDNCTVWNVLSVLNVLHALVDKSEINRQLEVFASGGDPSLSAGEFGRHPLYKMLGYFSLIGLLRLHSLLGDYYQAIKVLENIELHKKGMYARVPACQITTFYYVGFAYLMMRRYGDAIRTFSNILLYIQRTKLTYHVRGYQSDLVNKQTEQMLTLLAICLVLHPQSIDESVQTVLTEKYADKMLKMARGVREEFENAFTFACPKFLSPVFADVDAALSAATADKSATDVSCGTAATAAPVVDTLREPQRQQLRVFMDEIDQQMSVDMVSRFGSVHTATEVVALSAAARQASAASQEAMSVVEAALANDAGAEQISAARSAAERAQLSATVAGERAVAAVRNAVASGLDASSADPALLRDVSVPTIRSYLRLYTTMPVAKMSDFLDVDERRFLCYLLCFKHKMKNVVWSENSSGVSGGLGGHFQSDSEIDFYIDADMIHIADTKVAQRYGDYFIRQMHKLDDLTRTIAAIKA